MKRLGVFLLPPGWDASPSQGYPQHFAGTHLYSWVERGTVRVKNTTQCPQPGPEPGPLDPESSTLTMRPPRLPLRFIGIAILFNQITLCHSVTQGDNSEIQNAVFSKRKSSWNWKLEKSYS